TSAHRAKYLGQRGSGWEMLMQFGNTLIQDKVLVGLSAGLVGQPHETLIQEYLELPLKDTVKEKWLYGNAARVFGLACALRESTPCRPIARFATKPPTTWPPSRGIDRRRATP